MTQAMEYVSTFLTRWLEHQWRAGLHDLILKIVRSLRFIFLLDTRAAQSIYYLMNFVVILWWEDASMLICSESSLLL